MRLSIPSSLPGQAITVDKSISRCTRQAIRNGIWDFGRLVPCEIWDDILEYLLRGVILGMRLSPCTGSTGWMPAGSVDSLTMATPLDSRIRGPSASLVV
jgi:hypothetical protein